MDVLWFILEDFSLNVQKFLHKAKGSWRNLGIGALNVSSCREVIAYAWLVGSFISQPCKLCRLLMPPSAVADVTQQSCLLAVKWYFEVLYNEKQEMFKVAREMCLNARSGVSYHLQGEGILSGRILLSLFLPRITTGRICLLPLCLLCVGMALIGNKWMLMSTWSGRRSWWEPLCWVACYSIHTHGLGCTGMPRKKWVSSDAWLNKTWMRTDFFPLPWQWLTT